METALPSSIHRSQSNLLWHGWRSLIATLGSNPLVPPGKLGNETKVRSPNPTDGAFKAKTGLKLVFALHDLAH